MLKEACEKCSMEQICEENQSSLCCIGDIGSACYRLDDPCPVIEICEVTSEGNVVAIVDEQDEETQ